jgi:hypothetical protein
VAAVPADGIAAGGPVLPSIAPPAQPPTAGVPVELGAPLHGAPMDGPTANQVPKRGIRAGIGSMLRTAIVAALVAGAVFGGRFGWQWNQDRHAEAAAAEILPETPVAPVDSRYIEFQLERSDVVRAHVDLANGDFVATISGSTDVARTGGEYWTRDVGSDVWVPATPEFVESQTESLSAIEQASVVTVSDVLPVETHPYLTVVSDEAVALTGTMIPGQGVIEVDAPTATDDEAGDDVIVTAGNADPSLDVVDDIANPAVDSRSAETTPAGGVVFTRHLTVSIDRSGLWSTQPHLAESIDLVGDQPAQIELWIDATGVIRKMSAPSDVSRLWGEYELIAASSEGPGPVDALAVQPAAPAEEAGG